MSEENRRAAGEAMFERVYGAVVPVPPPEKRDTFVNGTIDHLFGEIWTRDVLDIRSRRLLILGAVLALGEVGIQEVQLRAALANGELTSDEAREILVFMVNYIGYPRASSFQQVLNRVLSDRE
ncbi:carboxymuconolactone decarboxylase family protein [Sphingomonas sp. KC8]|uniref:carboxymuconolactone decarboxylase family protein n=1 Tax=Sphingomonas sp. KC8 TaxID=1030157 RepID=UPI0002488E8C|nr:carboxymuconolactone decarboxylase family protein [Sphingomonas sp. KC8]ARS26231.1 4-carboxymuconolactone decarboxylase [Sphingomonas sp. KC8]